MRAWVPVCPARIRVVIDRFAASADRAQDDASIQAPSDMPVSCNPHAPLQHPGKYMSKWCFGLRMPHCDVVACPAPMTARFLYDDVPPVAPWTGLH